MSNNWQQQLDDFVSNRDELHARRALGNALRALPQADMPESHEAGWQALSQRLDQADQPDPKRPFWLGKQEWLGIAAALLVVVLVTFYRPPVIIPQGAQTQAASDDIQLQQLVAYSQRLEQQLRWLRNQNTGQVMSGRQALATDELESMISLVDLQIAAAQTTQDDTAGIEFTVNERTGLWQQRVALLSELLAYQYAGQYGGQALITTGATVDDGVRNQQI